MFFEACDIYKHTNATKNFDYTTIADRLRTERQNDIYSINKSALQLIRELSYQLESSFIELERSLIHHVQLKNFLIELESSSIE